MARFGVSKMGVFSDLTGKVFNGVEALEYLGGGQYKCRCLKCGKESIKVTSQIKRNRCHCAWRNTVNDDYFKEIDSREKAYFLGFLWADGYNSVEFHTCKIDLQERDLDILKKLKKAIDFSGRINSYIAKKGESYRPEEAKVLRLHITNIGFIQNLYDKGVRPHREKFHFPFEFVPREFYLDFIRGYFDGNGCCSVYGKRGLMVDICGGTNILHDIGDILAQEYGMSIKYHRRRPQNPDNDTLYISKRDDMITFLKLLYQDAPVYLDRKYEKYLKALELQTPDKL